MKTSNFQLLALGVFILFIVAGVITFALYSAKPNSTGPVVIWGTTDEQAMQSYIAQLNQDDRSFQDVRYIQKPANTFTTDVINAMASGQGPDIVMLSQDQIAHFANKIDTIPFSTISQSSYLSSYVNEGQLFLTPNGTLALPFLVDPLVMYWNRDLFQAAGIATPPKYWNDVLTDAQKLTVLDPSSNAIKQSAIAMGSWNNVLYAKNILSALFMQAGDFIVGGYPGSPVSLFGQTPEGASQNPASSASQFFTEFANPSKTSYSWNRSLPSSQDAFTGGTLAVYLGFASNYTSISSRNPNLNFAVALLPQIEGNSTHVTYGRLIGLAIPRTAANPSGALTIAEKMTSQSGAGLAAQYFGLPSVRLDAAQDTSGDAASAVFYQSALISRGWLDPDAASTDAIFSTMINDVVSNKSLPDQAVQEASQSIQALVHTSASQ
jgi:multiple sugar transport system substrate-binding protein